ncbi:hypothetical protein BZB76_5713 [Actinomadura pelletieri DSM 43383]|uniref:Uncharacterized protein n=1 Tax=Actinomadura pelletieri DSM 43383 TaxID=1120940 RepID=A0A495QH43_9ACTN|nr:hypothetical protein [Actinomadura pelletieri]RKS71226.1 hypothetical protein BZB76_5713 [Actinomadura pelletieri DSM 43383]
MRPDGDGPEPDDYGLPRVDVVVPDDARELERDVVAYRKEERRRRRRERYRRLGRPLTRFGIAIPIIAGALLIALLSGVLMTAFGPRPAPRPTGDQLAPRPSASPGKIGGLLPDGGVDEVTGERTPKRLRDVRPGVIAIVPPAYECESVVADLAGRTQKNELDFYLVADPRPVGDKKGMSLKDLKACAGTAHEGTPMILEDPKALLATAYTRQPGTPGWTGTALTAVFVQPDGVVNDVVQAPKPGPELAEKVKALTTG